METYNFKNPLYHGSRGGLEGSISPISRNRCDFGKGFYMGTNPIQAKTLVANDQSPYFYKLNLDIRKIPENRILELNDMEWAYFVLYNRGKLNSIKGTEFYNENQHKADNIDLIVGPIADDAMNEAMDRFMRNQITDKAFLESIRAIDYGIQYVAKTESACSCITILEEKELYGKELDDALAISNKNRIEGRNAADRIQLKYLREGKYFVELLDDFKKTCIHSRGIYR